MQKKFSFNSNGTFFGTEEVMKMPLKCFFMKEHVGSAHAALAARVFQTAVLKAKICIDISTYCVKDLD